MISVLGRGGMGVVYKGVHPVIGKQVAIKVLHPHISLDSDALVRFLAEARTVNTIRHRAIVDIFGYGQLPGGASYFVMEHLDGQDFASVLKARGRLPAGEALHWIDETLRPLAAAHALGVVHRDLKPSNLFLVDDPHGAPYLKLLDFGIAKADALFEATTPRTRDSIVLGTPEYMAPEQVRGEPITGSVDLCASGVLLFEFLTGHRPFVAPSAAKVMWMHASQPPPRARASNPDVPEAVDDLIQWLLAKSPSERPASAEDAGRAVEELRAAFPWTPEPRPEAPSAGRRATSGRRPAALARPSTPEQPSQRTRTITPGSPHDDGGATRRERATPLGADRPPVALAPRGGVAGGVSGEQSAPPSLAVGLGRFAPAALIAVGVLGLLLAVTALVILALGPGPRGGG